MTPIGPLRVHSYAEQVLPGMWSRSLGRVRNPRWAKAAGADIQRQAVAWFRESHGLDLTQFRCLVVFHLTVKTEGPRELDPGTSAVQLFRSWRHSGLALYGLYLDDDYKILQAYEGVCGPV